MRKSPTFTEKQHCKRCDNEFLPTGPRTFYCSTCRPIVDSERKKSWYKKNNPNAPREAHFCVACGEAAKSRYNNQWYCNKHWLRMYNNGTLDPQRKSKNTYTIKEDCVELISKRGEKILIDLQDFEKVIKHSWCITKSGYAVANIGGIVTPLHRYILSPSTTQIIDHINGNKLDNQRSNLRICDNKSNVRNSRLSKNSSMPYPGIRVTKGGRFKTRITVNRVEKSLGTYATFEEALQARQKAEIQFFGDYAPCLGSLKDVM